MDKLVKHPICGNKFCLGLKLHVGRNVVVLTRNLSFSLSCSSSCSIVSVNFNDPLWNHLQCDSGCCKQLVGCRREVLGIRDGCALLACGSFNFQRASSAVWYFHGAQSRGCRRCPTSVFASVVKSSHCRMTIGVSGQLHVARSHQRSTCRCVGLGAAELSNLRPVTEQALLMASMVLAYLVGSAGFPSVPRVYRHKATTPDEKGARQPRQSVKLGPVQLKKANNTTSTKGVWFDVNSKLSQAISQEHSESGEMHLLDGKDTIKTPRLSLQAIARGPRLYLLLITLQHLHKEIDSIMDSESSFLPSKWRKHTLDLLCNLILPVYKIWISGQGDMKLDKSGVQRSSISPNRSSVTMTDTGALTGFLQEQGEASNNTEESKFDAANILSKNPEFLLSCLKLSGKTSLYTDLIFFLRFGYPRAGSCLNKNTLTTCAKTGLEDMVVAIADVVATVYLEFSFAQTSLGDNGEKWPAFLLPSILSTRALERFRNEVALYRWLYENFNSVVAMFEDRFELWTLHLQPIQGQFSSSAVYVKQKGRVPNQVVIQDLILNRKQLPARRNQELDALQGWRYFYSLCLELFDVVSPLLQSLLARLGGAVSFFLVHLIGRSLGLICQGIKQSVKWSPS